MKKIVNTSENAGEYSDTLIINRNFDSDINLLFQKSRHILESKLKDKLNSLNSEKNQIINNLKNSLTVTKKRLFLQRLGEIEEEQNNIENENKLEKYNNLILPLVDYYNKLGPKKQIKMIFGESENSQNVNSQDPEIKNILDRFLKITESYIPLKIIDNSRQKFRCKNCDYDLNGVTNNDEENSSFIICPSCGLIRYIFQKFISLTSSTSDYEDRENFRKSMNRFQGKENIFIPKIIYEDLDDYFISFGLPTGEEIKAIPNIEDRKNILGKKILHTALSQKGYRNYYDDINLITHEYWGWNLPDISSLEEKIMYHYDKTEEVFKRIKGSRKASINTRWRLSQHLKICGYPVEYDDFKIIVTRDILEYYSQTWKRMCLESGDKEIEEGYIKYS